MTVQFQCLAIVVESIERSAAFYRDVFGFLPADVFEGSDPALDAMTQLEDVRLRAQIIVEPGGRKLELVEFYNPLATGSQVPDTIDRFGLTHLAFYVDDVDATRARALAAGGRALDDTRCTVAEDNIDMDVLFIADPDGVRIEVARVIGQDRVFLWNGIHVRDLERSTAYYAALGFEPAERYDLDEPRQWLDQVNQLSNVSMSVQVVRNPSGGALELLHMVSPPARTFEEPRPYNRFGLSNLAFMTDDRDGLAKRLEQRGGTMFPGARVEIEVNSQRLRQWHGIDPDGVRIELIEAGN